MKKVEIDCTMRGYILSDDIIDVEYVEISDEQQTASGNERSKKIYDKVARAAEIAEFAEKKAEEMNEKNDLAFEMMITVFILFGANWADENPECNFESSMKRSEAFFDEVEEYLKKVEAKGGRDHKFDLLAIMTTSIGMKWATNNPPKYY